MQGRVYDAARSLVEGLGGSMTYEREGYRHGAWVIRVGADTIVIQATGNQSFPLLDDLHTPKVANPQHWYDYYDELVPDAETRLKAMLSAANREARLSPDEAEDLRLLIERAKWKFAWTYARTYPHEYTTKALCAAHDHARLIELIERHGEMERFGDARRKYFYFDERKYWHMGNPSSDNEADWPNVINRTWLDVRRHAANVSHRWTAEEVELQMRLWEIQLEKATDRLRKTKSP